MAPILGIYASQISGHLFAPSGAYDSIATVNVGAGGASTITFSSIPSTYTHLQIRAIARNETAGTGGLESIMRYNGDTGSNYVTYHQMFGDGSAAFSGADLTQPTRMYAFFNPKDGNTASTYGAAVIDILDYANTSKYKTLRSLHGYDTNGAGYIILRSALWMSTSAINSITFTTENGSDFSQYSQFALYGIKGA